MNSKDIKKNVSLGDLILLEYDSSLFHTRRINEEVGFVISMDMNNITLSKYNPNEIRPWFDFPSNYLITKIKNYEVLRSQKFPEKDESLANETQTSKGRY